MRLSCAAWVAACVGLAVAAGCNHTARYDTTVPLVEEFKDPPHEPRFDNPPEQGYQKPKAKKEFKPSGGAGGGPAGGLGGGGQGMGMGQGR